jgi:hypothetical protein
MSVPLDKLNDHINQLVLWLRENEGRKLKAEQETRLKYILNQVKSVKVFSDEKVRKSKNKPKTGKYNLVADYINCDCCGVPLNVKNISKHKKKCRGQKEDTKAAY